MRIKGSHAVRLVPYPEIRKGTGIWSFPHSSVGKESTCNEEDPSSMPGSGGSAGEEIGYPLLTIYLSLTFK